MATPLPGQLRYLEPVFTELTRGSADRLNEDVDVSTLEGVLRGRVHGLTIPQAQERLDHDRSILRDWLKNSPSNHGSGQWVLAFLSYRPGLLARRLLAPGQPEDDLVEIIFEPPDGWSLERVPLSLNLRRGRKNMGAIILIEASSLAHRLHQNDVRVTIQSQNRNPFGLVGRWTKSTVQSGDVRGHKFLYRQVAPAPWKRVEYLLEVPGGCLDVMIDAGGKDFEESEFEGKLYTLRVVRDRGYADGGFLDT